MTEPLDIDAIRKRHTRHDSTRFKPYCDECEDNWPCDAVRLCDEVERLRRVECVHRWMAQPRDFEVSDEDRIVDILCINCGAVYMRGYRVPPEGIIYMPELAQSEAPTVSDGGKG